MVVSLKGVGFNSVGLFSFFLLVSGTLFKMDNRQAFIKLESYFAVLFLQIKNFSVELVYFFCSCLCR